MLTPLVSGKESERALKSQARGSAAHAGSFVLGEGIEHQDTARAKNTTQPGQCGEEGQQWRAHRPRGGEFHASVPGAGPRQREVHGARPPLPASPALHLHGALRPQVGPQHLLQPWAALMLTANAAWAQATSALGFSVFMAAIADPAEEDKGTWCGEKH